MDKLGVPQPLFIPQESWLYCSGASYLDFTKHSVIAASDGSVKDDGSMGAAAVIMSGNGATPSIALEQKGVDGVVCSTTPELVGLQLAVCSAPETDSLLVLTDSLCSLRALRKRQRNDFQRFEVKEGLQQHIDNLVNAVNERISSSHGLLRKITFAKVIGHSGNPK